MRRLNLFRRTELSYNTDKSVWKEGNMENE
jgi:hypothetical protein